MAYSSGHTLLFEATAWSSFTSGAAVSSGAHRSITHGRKCTCTPSYEAGLAHTPGVLLGHVRTDGSRTASQTHLSR